MQKETKNIGFSKIKTNNYFSTVFPTPFEIKYILGLLRVNALCVHLCNTPTVVCN